MKERFISLSILAALVLVTAPAHAAEVKANTTATLSTSTAIADTAVSARANFVLEARKCRALTDHSKRADCFAKLRTNLRGSSNVSVYPRPLLRPIARPLRRPATTSYILNLPDDLQKRIEACRAETDLEAKKECRIKLHKLIKEHKQATGPASWPDSLNQDIQVCRRDNSPNRTALISCIEAAFSAAGMEMPAKGPWAKKIGHTRQRTRFTKILSEDTRTHLKECREKSNGDLKVFRECAASVLGNGSVANTRLPHRFTNYNNSSTTSVDASVNAWVKTNLTPFSVKPIKSLTQPSLTPTW